MDGPKQSQHSAHVRAEWERIQSFINGEQVRIRGDTLDIASVVAVARYVLSPMRSCCRSSVYYRYGCQPELDDSPELVKRVGDSVHMLDEYLRKGYNVYG